MCISVKSEVTGAWRELHKDELYDLYSLSNFIRAIKSRKMRWSGQVARTTEKRGVYRVLVGKPEGKRPLGRPRHRWEYNIKMYLREVCWGAWTRDIWLMIGADGGKLQMR